MKFIKNGQKTKYYYFTVGFLWTFTFVFVSRLIMAIYDYYFDLNTDITLKLLLRKAIIATFTAIVLGILNMFFKLSDGFMKK